MQEVCLCPLPELRHKEVTPPSVSQQSISINASDVTGGGTEEEGVDALCWKGSGCESSTFSILFES